MSYSIADRRIVEEGLRQAVAYRDMVPDKDFNAWSLEVERLTLLLAALGGPVKRGD